MIPFYLLLERYVKKVLDVWEEDEILDFNNVQDSVVINKNEGWIIGILRISDYVY